MQPQHSSEFKKNQLILIVIYFYYMYLLSSDIECDFHTYITNLNNEVNEGNF